MIECVYCGKEEPTQQGIANHHWSSHRGKRYDSVWYIDD